MSAQHQKWDPTKTWLTSASTVSVMATHRDVPQKRAGTRPTLPPGSVVQVLPWMVSVPTETFLPIGMHAFSAHTLSHMPFLYHLSLSHTFPLSLPPFTLSLTHIHTHTLSLSAEVVWSLIHMTPLSMSLSPTLSSVTNALRTTRNLHSISAYQIWHQMTVAMCLWRL